MFSDWFFRAGVAQLVEHLICNQRVGGSNPFASSTSRKKDGAGSGSRFGPVDGVKSTGPVLGGDPTPSASSEKPEVLREGQARAEVVVGRTGQAVNCRALRGQAAGFGS